MCLCVAYAGINFTSHASNRAIQAKVEDVPKVDLNGTAPTKLRDRFEIRNFTRLE